MPEQADRLPWHGGAYSILRHGVSISSCDSEPVHTPGCIQDHGALLVLRPEDLGVLQASANTARWLGLPPEGLLGHPLDALIGAEAAVRIRGLLDREDIAENPQYALTLQARGGAPPLDVIVHTIDGVAVVEFEGSTRIDDRPDAACYGLVRQAVIRLQGAATLRAFCQAAAEQVRAVTALDRVMIYKFHEDGHGEVFAEARRDDLASWRTFISWLSVAIFRSSRNDTSFCTRPSGSSASIAFGSRARYASTLA